MSASDAAQTRIGGERSGLLNTLSYRPYAHGRYSG